MTKEQLKALGLTDEQINSVYEDYGKAFVTKDQFNQKNEEAKTLKEELKTVNKEIDNLKKSNADNETLTAQIEKLTSEAGERKKEYEATIKKMQIDSILDRTLLTNKAKNNTAVKALLQLDNAEIDGETIKGLDDQLKKLKASDAYLFESDTTPNVAGVTPGQGTGGAGGSITKEQFNKMSYAERTKLFTTNNELYTQLTKEN